MDNVDRTREVFDAFLRKDGIVVGRMIDGETVWRVPGASLMAGEYRGREEIFGFLRQTGRLTGGTYRADLRWVVGGGEVVAALYRATGRREGRELDIDQLLVFRYRGDVWAEVLAVPVDLDAFEAFWA
ncbi:MAG: nuclear transport factor 2 family protein [Gaiellaceae bacterium]